MAAKRALNPTERALWERVMASVKPLHPVRADNAKPRVRRMIGAEKPAGMAAPVTAPPAIPANMAPTRDNFAQMLSAPVRPMSAAPAKVAAPPTRIDPHRTPMDGGLDGHWDRRLIKGAVMPDVSVDLHGLGLAHAHARLDGVLEQSVRGGVRVILLVTGKLRDHDRASGVGGGKGRGAIRAAVTDWLAASRHHANIASVRAAHPRHGGDGALYIILKRGR